MCVCKFQWKEKSPGVDFCSQSNVMHLRGASPEQSMRLGLPAPPRMCVCVFCPAFLQMAWAGEGEGVGCRVSWVDGPVGEDEQWKWEEEEKKTCSV